jgi:hypothetical protein
MVDISQRSPNLPDLPALARSKILNLKFLFGVLAWFSLRIMGYPPPPAWKSALRCRMEGYFNYLFISFRRNLVLLSDLLMNDKNFLWDGSNITKK